MVNERVGASNWEDGDELGNTWVSRNAFRCVRCAWLWHWLSRDFKDEPKSSGFISE